MHIFGIVFLQYFLKMSDGPGLQRESSAQLVVITHYHHLADIALTLTKHQAAEQGKGYVTTKGVTRVLQYPNQSLPPLQNFAVPKSSDS